MTIKDFIANWNKTHKGVKFAAYKVSGMNCPVSVEVRYPELDVVRGGLLSKDWNQLNVLIEEESDDTLVVTTNEKSFEKGIIELKIAFRSKNFDERRVAWALEKIGEYLED